MMEIFEAIFARQSISKVNSTPIPHELLERLLEAAVQAPNHYRVRPWRFVVITGAGRERFGEACAQGLRARQPDAPSEALEAERAKALRAPVIIAVGVNRPDAPNVTELENICAVAAATQNLLLAAQGLGLAAIWRTGAHVHDPVVKEFLGLPPQQHLIGLIYLGYALNPGPRPQRPSFGDRTTWVE